MSSKVDRFIIRDICLVIALFLISLLVACEKTPDRHAPVLQKNATITDADAVVGIIMMHESMVKSIWSLAKNRIRNGDAQFSVVGPEGCEANFLKRRNEDQVAGFVDEGEIVYFVGGCIEGYFSLKVIDSKIRNPKFHPWRFGAMTIDTNIECDGD